MLIYDSNIHLLLFLTKTFMIQISIFSIILTIELSKNMWMWEWGSRYLY